MATPTPGTHAHTAPTPATLQDAAVHALELALTQLQSQTPDLTMAMVHADTAAALLYTVRMAKGGQQ